jgi:ligand-binding SRPBCC domain-containing protein
MKLTLQTRVEQDYLSVKKGFDQTLFQKLSPPFPPVKLLRFDGSSTGDLVVLELNFLFFKQRWTSAITEDSTDEKEFYFIDEGIELPFFLKTWRHKHRVIQDGTGSLIRDEINYTAPFGWMTVLLYPTLLAQFAFRIPIYKRLFKTKS